MIISNKHKWIYVRPSRTGSTSLSHQIRENCDITFASCLNYRKNYMNGQYYNKYGNLDLTPHSTLNDVKNYISIPEYTVYGIVRDPVDRFISCVYFSFYLKNKVTLKDNIEKHIEYYLKTDLNELPFRPQIDYFKVDHNIYNSNLFSYENIDELSIKLTNEPLKYTYWKGIREINIFDHSLKQEINSIYAEDKHLYEKTKQRHS